MVHGKFLSRRRFPGVTSGTPSNDPHYSLLRTRRRSVHNDDGGDDNPQAKHTYTFRVAHVYTYIYIYIHLYIYIYIHLSIYAFHSLSFFQSNSRFIFAVFLSFHVLSLNTPFFSLLLISRSPFGSIFRPFVTDSHVHTDTHSLSFFHTLSLDLLFPFSFSSTICFSLQLG